MFEWGRDVNRPGRICAAAAILLAVAGGCASHHHQPLVLSPWTAPTSRPSSQTTSRPVVNISAPNLEAFPGQTYFFESVRTTNLDLQQAITRFTSDLAEAANSGEVNYTGPCIFVLHARPTELLKPFTLDVGFPVAAGTRAFGHFQVRKLLPLRCAAVTFDGPGSSIDKAYDKLEPAIDAAHLTRTGETREIYLNWAGPDSPYDRIEVGIGVK